MPRELLFAVSLNVFIFFERLLMPQKYFIKDSVYIEIFQFHHQPTDIFCCNILVLLFEKNFITTALEMRKLGNEKKNVFILFAHRVKLIQLLSGFHETCRIFIFLYEFFVMKNSATFLYYIIELL